MSISGVCIASVDAKDLHLANLANPEQGFTLHRADGEWNLDKFINMLDHSLDLIKMREVYFKKYRNRRFSFWKDGREYCPWVVNVTFKYSDKLFNRKHRHFYIRTGYSVTDAELVDGALVRDGILIAIKTGQPVETPLPTEMLECFVVKTMEDGTYHYEVKSNIPTMTNVKDLRENLYREGFNMDGKHFVRYKRSSGSSRVGKCLFIEESLYEPMMKWSMMGLDINQDDPVDLASLESYISLVSSSIMGTMIIQPHEILLVDDYESMFEDEVLVTDIHEGALRTRKDTVTVTNSIFDGQSLIDESIMPETTVRCRDNNGRVYNKTYKPGMVLLRNSFFKSAAFNTNLQKFFADSGITSVSQLNGKTRAKEISDIKLVVCPSSIKFLKFGTWDDWLDRLDPVFGCVKHEKTTHFFEGELVRTHYQLLNTIAISQKEMDEFMEPTLNYLRAMRDDPALVRHYIHYDPDGEEFIASCQRDVAFSILGINDKFANTKVYYNFMRDIIKKQIKDIRKGHVLVHGNYSTLFGNGYEMLLHTIGRFDGTTSLPVGCIHSKKFDYDKVILGSRSPHVCMGNLWLPINVADDNLDAYFNLTNEIVCINSIGENVLSKLNGCDFDSDTVLLTDNDLLINVASKHYDDFLVPTSEVSAKKTQRYYNSEQQADLDVKTSQNKIGEIINCSQELNSLLWENLNKYGQTLEQNFDLYCDIAQLSVMSGIAIDAAKKEFDISLDAELKKIKKKYFAHAKGEKVRKPKFMGYIAKQKGYYDGTKFDYDFFETGMDYLQRTMNRFKLDPIRENESLPLVDALVSQPFDHTKNNRHFVANLSKKIDEHNGFVARLWGPLKNELPDSFKYQARVDSEQQIIDYLRMSKISTDTVIGLLMHADRNMQKSKHAQILNYLYASQNPAVLELFKLDNGGGVPVLIPDPDGELEYFGIRFKKEKPLA